MYIIARLGVFEGLSVARANGIDPGAMVEIALASSGYSEALCRWRAEGAQHVVTPDAFDGRPRGGSRVLQTALMATRAGGFDLPLIDAVLELSEQNR
jgi:3-hydroxyisobutyrate dehydrogenase-like beta-hydroxyacid dehydrogenase